MLQREYSAALSTFIKLPFVIKILVLSFFDLLFKTGILLILDLNPVYSLAQCFGSVGRAIDWGGRVACLRPTAGEVIVKILYPLLSTGSDQKNMKLSRDDKKIVALFSIS